MRNGIRNSSGWCYCLNGKCAHRLMDLNLAATGGIWERSWGLRDHDLCSRNESPWVSLKHAVCRWFQPEWNACENRLHVCVIGYQLGIFSMSLKWMCQSYLLKSFPFFLPFVPLSYWHRLLWRNFSVTHFCFFTFYVWNLCYLTHLNSVLLCLHRLTYHCPLRNVFLCL
jgi:hypothetical protein